MPSIAAAALLEAAEHHQAVVRGPRAWRDLVVGVHLPRNMAVPAETRPSDQADVAYDGQLPSRLGETQLLRFRLAGEQLLEAPDVKGVLPPRHEVRVNAVDLGILGHRGQGLRDQRARVDDIRQVAELEVLFRRILAHFDNRTEAPSLLTLGQHVVDVLQLREDSHSPLISGVSVVALGQDEDFVVVLVPQHFEFNLGRDNVVVHLGMGDGERCKSGSRCPLLCEVLDRGLPVRFRLG
mmetsp:Transcript_80633/g.261276  ORF Transcript_80633/g.261276 Transcript_80633/m.261276 type:complete len:238 (-) Transcript_80633:1806-2519(-)